MALGSFDNFDMMALSYFHAVLFGDGTHEIRRSQDTNEMVPLFEAIERSSREGVNALTQAGHQLKNSHIFHRLFYAYVVELVSFLCVLFDVVCQKKRVCVLSAWLVSTCH